VQSSSDGHRLCHDPLVDRISGRSADPYGVSVRGRVVLNGAQLAAGWLGLRRKARV